MVLKSSCGCFKYHFELTPAGWTLLCFGHNPMHVIPDDLTYRNQFARKRQEFGDTFIQSVFGIDFIGSGIVNIVVDLPDLKAIETKAMVMGHLQDLEDEFALGILNALEQDIWDNLLIGLNKTRHFRTASRNAALTLQPSSEPQTI